MFSVPLKRGVPAAYSLGHLGLGLDHLISCIVGRTDFLQIVVRRDAR